MYSLFIKEIKAFLGSLIGYLALAVFLLLSGLFLWVFPGTYNIPDNGYATLNGLFQLAPWLYLFLVPAITMRFFADEKRSGTIEILLTHPISDFKIVFAKFLAGLVLVIFSLIPTLLYFLSVYLLGAPIGSIDAGATWGSFIGLFFLASIYVAIGVFSSSLTDNQIVSFILAMMLSFVFYLGFEFIASAEISYTVERLLTWFSINEHYLSISRGVVDMRDLVYFLGMTFLFLFITKTFLRKGKWRSKRTRISFISTMVVTLVMLLVSNNFLWRYDLTAEKRYTLSNVSKQIASELEDNVEVELYLDGELEAGLRKIQNEVLEKIAVLNAYAQYPIRIRIFDPYQISNQEKQDEFIGKIIDKGVRPVSFRHKTEKGTATKYIFPGAIVRSGGREVAVNFLKNNLGNHELNFNYSVETSEYELIQSFRKVMQSEKSTLAFFTENEVADQYQLADLARELTSEFEVLRLGAGSLRQTDADILVIANPKRPFTENTKFEIDQYIMNGGKVVWLIDPVSVSLDSLSKGETTYSFPRDLNLNDQLFRYGVRLNYELLQDVNCVGIRVNTAAPGNPEKFTLHPWYYSPLLTPNDFHPLSRNLNWVMSEFVSSIDTVSDNEKVHKSVILSTSMNARKIKAPSSVSLRNIDNPPARELFTQSNLPVGVLLEGIFTSNYKNRMVENYGISSTSVRNESKPTKMVVIADGGLASNKVRYSTNPPQIQELGRDIVSGRIFGNKEFLVNTMLYLADKKGVMQLRGRTLKMRLLDKVKIREEKRMWQWINVVSPLLLVALFGLLYNLIRRYEYNRS